MDRGTDALVVAGSSLTVSVPATLLSNGFSRGHEREADQYAFALLKRHGKSPRDFATLMSRLMKAHGMGEAIGFAKLVADAKYGEILGLHMIGPEVTELLPEMVLAQQWDLTADEVGRNVHAHPTLSEALKETVEGIAGHMINF